MISINFLFWLVVSLTVISHTVSVDAQNTSELTQWFVPLDLGKQLKIQCDGSLAEFVSDCTSPASCKSLWLVENNILECIPDSRFRNTGEKLIFP